MKKNHVSLSKAVVPLLKGDAATSLLNTLENAKIKPWTKEQEEQAILNMEKVIERRKMRKKIEYFKEDMVGRRYRHFKGEMYIVTDIALHTEKEEILVVYKSFKEPYKTYARPIEMFLSEVDKGKYPNAKQKMRFEKVVQ